MNNEKYFVGSDCDEPVKIFFKRIDAFASKYNYIDSFDENGNKVRSYKFVDPEYITDF